MKIPSPLLLAFAAVLFSMHIATAGTFYSYKAGDFADRNNWSTTSSGAQSIPSSAAWGSNDGWDNVLIVTHAMTLASGSYSQWGSSSSLTINSGGSVKRTGTLSLTGSGIVITVNSGGAFETTGALTMDGSKFTSAGTSSNIIGGLTLSNSSSSSFVNGGTITINGAASISGPLVNSGSLTVTGAYTQENSGKSTISSGTFNAKSNVSALGLIQLNPGASSSSTMTIDGTLTVNDNPWIVVGTNVSACNTTITNYANLIVKTNLVLTGSGDVTVNQNGRLIVFGNIARSGGSGNVITLNCGAQAYVNGNIDLGTGGGNTVTNSNGASSPTGTNGSPIIGLYVNGTVTAQNVSGTTGSKSDLLSNNSNFFNFIAGISGSPLPISLIYFKVDSVSPEGIMLAWATATELNFDHFNLQRSMNGKDFETIAKIQGHGTTKEEHNYTFIDKFPSSGTSYYRLQSVDLDGYTETFNVLAVKFEGGREVDIYPNPVTDSNLNFHLNFEPTSEILVTVTSVSGIERIREVIKDHFTDMKLNLTLEPGVYIIKMASIDFNKVSRIVVK